MSKPVKAKETPVASSSLLTRFQEDVDRMERLFDDFWPARMTSLRNWAGPRLGAITAPAVDVFEEGDDVVVKAEVPGAKKDEIEVNLNGSMLTISGTKERSDEVKEENYYRCERSYGGFARTVELPAEVQHDKARASFKDGVLEIRLPRTAEAKKKSVKVKIN